MHGGTTIKKKKTNLPLHNRLCKIPSLKKTAINEREMKQGMVMPVAGQRPDLGKHQHLSQHVSRARSEREIL
jgi:hypothetical protein